MSVITLTTDFGPSSPYVAAMKGVILSLNPRATIVDLTNGVPPQDLRYASIVLEDVSDRFPPGSIHITVVDPGVGTDRAIVYAHIGRQCYIAPDNGVLSRITRRIHPSLAIRLTEPEYWLHPVSSTFHGRDIMAPVAARLSLGLEPNCLGVPMDKLVTLEWPPVHIGSRGIEGSVIWIDSFGNLITDITAEMLVPGREGVAMTIEVLNRQIGGISRTYAEHEPSNVIALVDSSGRLEIAVVEGNAAEVLKAQIGDRVAVRWSDVG